MTGVESRDPLVDRVLSTGNRRLLEAAAQGMMPLPPRSLVALQVALALNEDERVAELAKKSLEALEPKIIADVLSETASDEMLTYFADHRHHPLILETVLLQRSTPLRLLTQLAPHLGAELQEILLLRQDAIVEEPEILDRLEANPGLSSYSARRIKEYRRHLLPVASEAVEAPTGEVEEATDEEVRRALEKARAEPPEGEGDELTGLSEGQIRTLPVPVRLRLARGATRTLRAVLVRDKNPQVACAVMTSNSLADSEVEQIAGNRAVIDDVLKVISRSRQWTRKYAITCALVRNPRTPAGLAVRLMPRLAVRDLLGLSRDRNVTEVVRSRAAALYKIKSH